MEPMTVNKFIRNLLNLKELAVSWGDENHPS
jgi:hypothetical protein